MPLENWWRSSQGSRRHGTLLVREVEVGTDVRTLGFSVTGKPPHTVMVKRVSPGGWASQHDLHSGDVLLELTGVSLAVMTPDDFLDAMAVRPLRLTFVVNPLRASLAGLGPEGAKEEEEDTDEEESDGAPEGEASTAARQSLSDWYAADGGETPAAGRDSLTGWYLDGEQPPDTRSPLTVVRRMTESAEMEVGASPSEADLAEELLGATAGDDALALMAAISRAREAGIMSEAIDAARDRLQQLQEELGRAAAEAF